jgi:ADP-ribose pyrophosphatase YjhB (NUDIX family)
VLHLIPPSLHRAALRVAHRLRLLWWRLRRPVLQGCRVLAFDSEARVLLVRHGYGSSKWMLPGGGISRRETPGKAATRELAEETGCRLYDAQVLAVVEEPLSGAINRVHLITGRIEGSARPDGREIVELAWFAGDALPDNLSPALAGRIGEWIVLANAVRGSA